MTRRRSIAFLVVISLGSLGAARALAADPVRAQFAYAIPIDFPPGVPLQWVELPLAVYRDSVDPAVNDLRVLNGKGEEVPYTLQPAPPAVAAAVSPLRLPLFPLRGDPAAVLSELSLRMRDGSTVIELQGNVAAAEAPVTAYLIDARRVGAAIETLVFELPEAAPDFSVSALLEVSEDLADWRPFAGAVPLTRLRHGGEIFESRGFSFRPTRANYWRLSAPPGASLPSWSGVSALPVSGNVPVDRQAVTVAGQAIGGATGEYEFDVGANVPVDRLDLELPDINTVARVQYFTRRAASEPWRPVARANVHRLQAAPGELHSPPLAVPTEASRYWRVVVDPRGGGLGAGVPRLRAGWLAHRVVFVARGAPPFELVYGNYAAKNAETALADLLPGGSFPIDAVLAQPPGVLGAAGLAGGAGRLSPPPPPGNWRLGFLWAALCIGVLSLAAVAWRLARQMRAE